jgi:gliding motility-associated-like protein
MKRLFYIPLFFFLFSANSVEAQTINISGPDFGQNNPLNCVNYNDGSVVNFLDNGGNGNYLPNSADTLTICPNLPSGPKIIAAFGVNAGFSFNIHPSDTLYVFDGPDVNAPLLGAYNSGNFPNGFNHNSSFENNPSGCLTFVFHSDGANEGTGWGANITCGNPPQPFYPHIEAFINGQGANAMNPLDTGYVDVCFGDSILLVAKPDFPYSNENNGFGYNQNLNNVTYNWQFSNGTIGANNDSIWFTPPARAGYFVDLRITDIFPQTERMTCKIRVSQLPSFEGTGPLKDTVCVNEQTVLLGGVNETDTVGVQFPPGSFEIGGSFAGLTPLPDGSGVNYSTSINMSGFPDGATFSDASDLQSVCVNMEHSYLGDLEMWLVCPNGTQAVLFNANTGGFLPGGFGGGGTFLGDANDQGNGTPGIGFDYCFSSVNNTWGTMAQEFGANNTVPVNSFAPPAGNAMNPNGVYLPETNFSAFNGCPLNGNWTLFIRDNLSIDDGYIFEWGLYFDASLFPNNETYTNYIVNHWWEDDPTIVSDMNDTLIIVQPGSPGTYFYTFVVEDNFGCSYDTTVRIIVKDPIVLNMPTSICALEYTTTLNTGTNAGVWSFFNSAGIPTFAQNEVNTTITFSDYGVYNLVYSDTSCTDADTVTILVDEPPYFNFDADFFVCDGGTEYLYFADSTSIATWSWSLQDPVQDALFSANLPAGTYTASYVNNLGCSKDTTFTIATQPPIVLSNYPVVCNDTLNMNLNTGPNTGVWSVINAGIGNPLNFASNEINTLVTANELGVFTLVYYDENCLDGDTITVEFNRPPYTQILDSTLCTGEIYVMYALDYPQNDNYQWSNGQQGGLSISVDQEGQYWVSVNNNCGFQSDSATVMFITCDLDVPNVFTPNGDGANDNFQLVEYQGLQNFNILILNRWGNVMREFNDPSFQWDGTDKNGNPVTEGVYFYVVKTETMNGKPIEKHGFVQLIRE